MEHVGSQSEVVSGDEGSVCHIWSKSKIPFDVRLLAYLFSRSHQAWSSTLAGKSAGKSYFSWILTPLGPHITWNSYYREERGKLLPAESM